MLSGLSWASAFPSVGWGHAQQLWLFQGLERIRMTDSGTEVAPEVVSTFPSPAPPCSAHTPVLWGLSCPKAALIEDDSACWKMLPSPRGWGRRKTPSPSSPQFSGNHPLFLPPGLIPPHPLRVSLPDPVPLQPWVTVTTALSMGSHACTAQPLLQGLSGSPVPHSGPAASASAPPFSPA